MPASKNAVPEAIYQVKVTLSRSKPVIWRRILVADNTPLPRLHRILQIVMGWTNSHLHQYIVNGEFYGEPSDYDWRPTQNEKRYRLRDVAPAEGSSFVYEYDFGDSWQHELLVEKVLPFNSDAILPLCIKGARACPPEDVGGIPGYQDFLVGIKNPNHINHEQYLEWIGGTFDPAAFDKDAVNQALRRLK